MSDAHIRLYHVVVINIKTGEKTYMTASPEKHDAACVLLRKLTKYTFRRNQLEEVKS